MDSAAQTAKVAASVQTDVGCVREVNEDCGRHVRPSEDGTHLRLGTLTIVADGMGGHASGEVASRMAVELISGLYYADHRLSPQQALRAAVLTANESIFEKSRTSEELSGMGTTLIALVIQDGQAFSAHVGDSRLYRFRENRLELLTIDHSQVMEMVRHGVISMEEAQNHDDKNIILRAVGTQPSVEVEVSDAFPTRVGDMFLLCSDGLSDMLTDREIETILQGQTDLHAACQELITAAKDRGGHDNITVGLVSVGGHAGAEQERSVRATREIVLAV